MHLVRLTLSILLLASTSVLAQKTNDLIKDLQRDVAQLQADLKINGSKMDERLPAIQALLQQALSEAGGASKGVAVLDRILKDSLRELQQAVSVPVATLGTKVDALATEYGKLGENVDDLSKRLNRSDAKLNEALTLVKQILAKMEPPPVPPAPVESAKPAAVSNCPAGSATPEQVYTQAMRDKESGKFNLALQEFRDFLTCWPAEDRASNAQFYIGEVHYNSREFDEAIAAFDLVIEKYPDGNKTPDAMYLKGRALVQTDQKNKARTVLTECAKSYGNTEAGRKCRDLLRGLVGSTAASPGKRKSK
jgi:tol-pal system protein YbgF